MWCLIGFHGNHSHINDIIVATILDFQSFRFFHIQIEHWKLLENNIILQICKKVVWLTLFFNKNKLNKNTEAEIAQKNKKS